jgi:hypothetical protein
MHPSLISLEPTNNPYLNYMQAENKQAKTGDMMLTSPAGTPYPFSIIIRNAWPANQDVCTFEIKGTEAKVPHRKLHTYELYNREHDAYLDFYEKLSNDFELRLPQNRKAEEKKEFEANYREVLTANLTPRILYGYGDPAIIEVIPQPGSEVVSYYLLATSNDAPDAFPILRSPNLIDWQLVGYVFPAGSKPLWASDGKGQSDYWAPEMHKVKDEYRVYFVARQESNLELCIGVARSAKPGGPFVPDDTPLLKGNVIDPHLFVENDETAFLYWKEDNNDVWPRLLLDLLYDHPELVAVVFPEKEDRVSVCFVMTLWPWARMLDPMERFQAIQLFIEIMTSDYTAHYARLKGLADTGDILLKEKISSILRCMKTPIFAQQLSPDGSTLIGERIRILENDLEWEAHLVEGIWVTKQREKYYLFYAGNDFSTSQYGIGAAIADSPVGPFKKMTTQLLKSTERWWAPGHPSLVRTPNGETELFLHAFEPGKAGYKQFRALLSIRVHFTNEGVYLR